MYFIYKETESEGVAAFSQGCSPQAAAGDVLTSLNCYLLLYFNKTGDNTFYQLIFLAPIKGKGRSV